MDTGWPRQPISSVETTCLEFIKLASLKFEASSRNLRPTDLGKPGRCEDVDDKGHLGAKDSLDEFTQQILELAASPVALEVQKWLIGNCHPDHPSTIKQDGATKRRRYQNPYSKSFFANMHLRNRDPLPFGENFSVQLCPLISDPPTPLSTLLPPRTVYEQAACLLMATLQFWATMYGLILDDTIESSAALCSFFEAVEKAGALQPTKGATQRLEYKQYLSIFGAARLPRKDKDHPWHGQFSPLKLWKRKERGECKEEGSEGGDEGYPYFIVMYRGVGYRVDIRDWRVLIDGERGCNVVCQLVKVLEAIVEEGRKEESDVVSVGMLSCMARDMAADVRLSVVDTRNKSSLQQLQESLFVICLDEGDASNEIGEEKEAEKETDTVEDEDKVKDRLLFNFVDDRVAYCNRWFEKPFQIIVSHPSLRVMGDNASTTTARAPKVGLNFEHSFIDSSACHKFCSFLYRRAQQHLQLLSDSSPSLTPALFAWQKLERVMEDSLKEALDRAKGEAYKTVDRLLPCCFDSVIDGIGKSTFKRLKCSPDGCFQTALQLGLSALQQETVYCLETIDIRHFEDGRLMIADTYTSQLRDLGDYVGYVKDYCNNLRTKTRPEEEEIELKSRLASEERERVDMMVKLGELFQQALKALGDVITRHKVKGQEIYLHLAYLCNETGIAEGKELNAISVHPIYENVYNHYVVGSNLGADEGIEFVYSGIPPEQSQMNVLGYMLLEDRIAFTFTSRTPVEKDKLYRCLRQSLSLVQTLGEISLATTTLVQDNNEELMGLWEELYHRVLGVVEE